MTIAEITEATGLLARLRRVGNNVEGEGIYRRLCELGLEVDRKGAAPLPPEKGSGA